MGSPATPSLSLEAAESEARHLLSKARAEAAQLIEQARAEADAIRREAWEAGRDEGRRVGRQEAEAEMQASVQSLQQMVSRAVIDRRQMVQSAREQIVNLVLMAAEKVVRRQLEGDRSAVVRVVEEALAQVGSEEPVTIRVNPLDWETVSLYWARTHAAAGEGRQGEIVMDEHVSAGGCVVEFRGGSVNGEVEVQLEEIAQALRG